ncbi:MAG: hypothetical protein CL840_00180 [Crocinitomicaceae bacterium]|nr:hypothetical protein [Crocinitomicaceae bacterium]|tara:strand:- start:1310 stop:2026 length:717 start_codon:yes stop_codon:yes gene_type:complete
MTNWNLTTLLEGLHNDIHQRLEIARKTMGDMVAKGDASEAIWLQLFQDYLPKRYQAEKAFVVDSNGRFSDQMDIVIFDRQYSPFIFKYEEKLIIPSESVYAVFEAKQTVNKGFIEYAQEKVESVRKLHRTSLPIPHAGGTYPAKLPIDIIGGILCFESDWNPAFGDPIKNVLETNKGGLDFGCVAAHGYFFFDKNQKKYEYQNSGKPATDFLFKLISQLQFSGTVPMIDIMAYSKWIK